MLLVSLSRHCRRATVEDGDMGRLGTDVHFELPGV